MVVCRFFLQGNCRNGDNCKFEHPTGKQGHQGGQGKNGPRDNNNSANRGGGQQTQNPFASNGGQQNQSKFNQNNSFAQSQSPFTPNSSQNASLRNVRGGGFIDNRNNNNNNSNNIGRGNNNGGFQSSRGNSNGISQTSRGGFNNNQNNNSRSRGNNNVNYRNRGGFHASQGNRGGNRGGGGGGGGGNGRDTNHSLEQDLLEFFGNPNLAAVRQDLKSQLHDRPVWPFSAFGPGLECAPRQLIGLTGLTEEERMASLEVSAEEVRLEAYNMLLRGESRDNILKKEAAVTTLMNVEIETINNNLDAAIKWIIDGKHIHPNRYDLYLQWNPNAAMQDGRGGRGGRGVRGGRRGNRGGRGGFTSSSFDQPDQTAYFSQQPNNNAPFSQNHFQQQPGSFANQAYQPSFEDGFNQTSGFEEQVEMDMDGTSSAYQQPTAMTSFMPQQNSQFVLPPNNNNNNNNNSQMSNGGGFEGGMGDGEGMYGDSVTMLEETPTIAMFGLNQEQAYLLTDQSGGFKGGKMPWMAPG